MEQKVRDLIHKFITSKGDYGEITNIDVDPTQVCDSIKTYIMKNDLPLYVLKCQNLILLSKNKPEFGRLYDVIKKICILIIEKGILEIWDDEVNKLLNVVFPSIRRHFLVRYLNVTDRSVKIDAILSENP